MDTPLTRKQQEILDREELILDVAAQLLKERGFHGLTMERIAAEIQYSKGTVYQHFSSKEDLLGVLAIRNTNCRRELFAKGSSLQGSTRERMTAIGVGFDLQMRLYPDRCNAESMYHRKAVQSKSSPETIALAKEADSVCDAIVGSLIEEAIAAGDLKVGDPSEVADLHYGLWALSWGVYQIMESVAPEDLQERGFQDPRSSLRRNQERLLDGFGWGPLSHEYDYEATRERALQEVFAEEVALIQQLERTEGDGSSSAEPN